jgi:processing peptidase subunit beta
LFFNKSQLGEAVSFLSEVILKPTFESVQVEALKSNIYKNAATMDPFKNTLQMVHYTAFRDHYLGQPSTGIRENTYSITSDQVKQFHNQFYVGENIVVSGAGEIDSTQFNDLVNQHFGSARASVEGQVANKEQPYLTPSLMFQRDD